MLKKDSAEILLVKAILKISSALDNLDQLRNSNLIHKKFMREFETFDKWFCENTSEYTIQMSTDDWESYSEIVYNWMDWFDDSVISNDADKKHLGLFLTKLFSAYLDLLQINNVELTEIFLNRLRIALSRKFISESFNLRDFGNLVKEVNQLFNLIITT